MWHVYRVGSLSLSCYSPIFSLSRWWWWLRWCDGDRDRAEEVCPRSILPEFLIAGQVINNDRWDLWVTRADPVHIRAYIRDVQDGGGLRRTIRFVVPGGTAGKWNLDTHRIPCLLAPSDYTYCHSWSDHWHSTRTRTPTPFTKHKKEQTITSTEFFFN